MTAAERAAVYPCDALVHPPVEGLWRAVDVGAPTGAVFRWLCQLKVAPYSHDLLDNAGRGSPRRLTPGAERLERGQRILGIFELVDFARDEHLTMTIRPAARRVVGAMAVSDVVRPAGAGATRLVVKQALACPRLLDRLRLELLAPGDLLLMRKQLRTLKRLAEAGAGGPL